MLVVSHLDHSDLQPLSRGVISIGNFDGVHLGHRMLLQHMQDTAMQQGLSSLIISFQPPSKSVFQGVPFLSSADEKLRLLQAFAPDAVVMIPFSHDYAKTDKQVFIDNLQALQPQHIIVGEDFRFGHRRSGTLNDLSAITGHLEVFGLKKLGDTAIKSSHIRQLLQQGDVAAAQRFLGYSYSAGGQVIRGQQRGRQLGFPTANLDIPSGKALPLGVFAVWVTAAAGRFAAMANVGPRPSFPEEPPALEVHLLDFEGDLYGQVLEVEFQHFLRGQQRFAGLDALRAQLSADSLQARQLLQP